MSANALFPLRPSLQRGNISTNSVPLTLDVREKPLARSALGMSVHAASSNASLMSPPHMVVRDLAASSDMQRAGSADSHRTIKKKQSKKELREMQRSASAMSATPPTPVQALPPPTSYSKHKYSRSWEEDDDNDDARSVSSFTCSFATEFDSKQKAKPCKPEEAQMKQRYLDAVFRKLTQKTGISRRESGAWAIVDKKLMEERNRAKASQKARKVKPHFLDLSGLISPLPPMSPSSATSSSTGSLTVSLPDTTDNVTPRPSDFSRFQSNGEGQNEVGREVPKMQAPPLLRARLSTEALNEGRRMQKDEWAAAALASIHSAGSGDFVSGSSLGLTVGQVVPAGMSHVMIARAAAAASNFQQQQQQQQQQQHPGQKPTPLGSAQMPSLPDRARDNNRTLHHQSGQRSIDMGWNKPTASSGLRAIDMGRAASHDATPMLSQSPVRQIPTLRGVSGPVRGHASPDPHFYIPPSLQLRSQARMGSRGQASPHSQGRVPLPLEDCTSPTSVVPTPQLHRISTGSTASDSGASSGISSVPQTPISRTVGLSTMQPLSMQMHHDGSDEQMELTADQEDHLLSGSGLYGMSASWKGNEYGRFAAPPLSMTPRPGQKRVQHGSKLSDGQNAIQSAAVATTTPVRSARPQNGTHMKSSSGSMMTSSSSMESEDGMMTVKANRVQQRARANTLSSVQGPSNVAAMASTKVAAMAPASPQSPSRTSSLQKKMRNGLKGPASPPSARDSMMSSHSNSTTSSSSSSSSIGGGSHSQSLLSYARGSPTPSDVAPSAVSRSPSSSSRIYSSGMDTSPTKRPTATSKAEDWATSIGRRFTRGNGIRRESRESDTLASTLPNEAVYGS